MWYLAIVHSILSSSCILKHRSITSSTLMCSRYCTKYIHTKYHTTNNYELQFLNIFWQIISCWWLADMTLLGLYTCSLDCIYHKWCSSAITNLHLNHVIGGNFILSWTSWMPFFFSICWTRLAHERSTTPFLLSSVTCVILSFTLFWGLC
jgi:hypothetical protein